MMKPAFSDEEQRRIKAIADEDGVTPQEVEAGIAEVDGLLSMIAADSEIEPDSVARITQCPICNGDVGFAPLCMGDLPRVNFTPDTTWRQCREEWAAWVNECYEKAATEQGVVLSPQQRQWQELTARPYGLILECHKCGKGFNAR